MTKEEAVTKYSKLIYKIAAKFYGVSKEDLYQAGISGLLKAYEQYKDNSNAKFSTFAYKYIFGEMYLLANKKIVKINRDTLKLYKHIESKRYFYAQEYGHVPTNKEMAKLLNLPLATVDYVCASSLDILSMDNDNESERNMYETIPDNRSNISIEDKLLLYESLDKLPKEEKEVIIARYFKDQTQDIIASNLNTSQVKVSRLEKKGLSRIRNIMSA